jgi:hypothetical protein
VKALDVRGFLAPANRVGYVVSVHSAVTDYAPAVVVAEAANCSQAEYFITLLNQSCVEIDHRIAECESVMTRYQARGSLDEVRQCRRTIRIEERERQQLQWMIAALHHRFPSNREGAR